MLFYTNKTGATSPPTKALGAWTAASGPEGGCLPGCTASWSSGLPHGVVDCLMEWCTASWSGGLVGVLVGVLMAARPVYCRVHGWVYRRVHGRVYRRVHGWVYRRVHGWGAAACVYDR